MVVVIFAQFNVILILIDSLILNDLYINNKYAGVAGKS